MSKHVWTYWKCTTCSTIIRGDSRTCPNCGTPISEGTKYLMPDNAEVIKAVNDNRILIGDNISIDDNGVKSEVVPECLKSDNPNWNCSYCGYQNKYENIVCESCGANKSESEKDYFGNEINMNNKNKEDYENLTGHKYVDNRQENTNIISQSHNPINQQSINNIIDSVSTKDVIIDKLKRISVIVLPIMLIIFLVWLFIPVTRESEVTGFQWERTIEVETFTCCHESGWSLPKDATLTDKKQEIHHYNQVLDHYEKKSKQVAEEVLDGYDTSYEDLGNGQAKEVKTPRYKTVYKTEYYNEPVYISVPEYRTKYYYDIGRWKKTDELNTAGFDKNPYWYETNIPVSISNPTYNDKKQGKKIENYYVIIIDEKGKIQNIKRDYTEWISFSENDKITYKTFRFSQKPL